MTPHFAQNCAGSCQLCRVKQTDPWKLWYSLFPKITRCTVNKTNKKGNPPQVQKNSELRVIAACLQQNLLPSKCQDKKKIIFYSQFLLINSCWLNPTPYNYLTAAILSPFTFFFLPALLNLKMLVFLNSRVLAWLRLKGLTFFVCLVGVLINFNILSIELCPIYMWVCSVVGRMQLNFLNF